MGRLLDIASDRFRLPEEIAGELRLTLTGDGRILAENHRGILEYSPERISLAAGRLTARVSGEGLHLLAMDGCSMIISGKIFGIDLE